MLFYLKDYSTCHDSETVNDYYKLSLAKCSM